jgi:hypothetical protein
MFNPDAMLTDAVKYLIAMEGMFDNRISIIKH